ncbi:uncharacterized protein JCM15063_004705 [Sporobolomyces koalae]|uniref:uncharacterized protein n=1 Tax=Sporobolomyces koalae TaxID=500713 RepID=UPI003177D42B
MLRTAPLVRRSLQARPLPLVRRLATPPFAPPPAAPTTPLTPVTTRGLADPEPVVADRAVPPVVPDLTVPAIEPQPVSPPAPVAPLSDALKQKLDQAAHRPETTAPGGASPVPTSKLPEIPKPELPSKADVAAKLPSFGAPPPPPPPKGRFRSFLLSSALFLGTAALFLYAYDSRAGVHRWLSVPVLMQLTKDDPERAHELAIAFLESGLTPKDLGVDDERLAFELWGKKFSNPVGMAAGFDKHGQAIDGLFDLGFGYVEVGSVTPVPQPGNPKPRVFRVPETNSVVNRYGFNSEGHDATVTRLRTRVQRFLSRYASVLPSDLFPAPEPNQLVVASEYDPVAALLTSQQGEAAKPIDDLGLPRSMRQGKVLGINLGKNKVSDPDSIDDFVKGIHTLGPYADVLVVNVSSPNTPGLRNLQRKGMLSELLEGVVAARNGLGSNIKPPVLVKVAPDLTDDQIEDIAHAVKTSRVDGVIVSNTTISRPASAGKSPNLRETGGLSGPPVKPLALKALSALYEQTDGKVPLIGCGGISSGADALEFGKAGASLVQLYTGFVYHGVGLPAKIKDELTELLKAEGKTWSQIVGTGRVKPETAQKIKEHQKPLEAKQTKPDDKQVASKPTESDFKKGLDDAKIELESLFKQLADAEPTKKQARVKPDTAPPADLAATLPASSAPQPSAEPTAAPAHPATGEPAVAVPAPVAEATVSPFVTNPLTDPTPATSSKPPTPDSKLPPPVAPSSPTPSQNIDHSALAVPANALLDDKAIKAMLDPAKDQVKQGMDTSSVSASVKEQVEVKVTNPVKDGGKRWV